MDNVSFGSKYAFTMTRMFWRAGAVGALSFGLLVCGAAVLCMMCLFRLSDISDKWDGDALGQLFIMRSRVGHTTGRAYLPSADAEWRGSSRHSLYLTIEQPARSWLHKARS